MKRTSFVLAAFAALAAPAMLCAAPARAANVKVTPLGSHDGEFCSLDRALIFEDPDGTRILYDAGRTVRGPEDPRLGRIDAVLLTHLHGDHLGDKIQPAANAGTCAKPDFSVDVTPNSNTVNIVVAKKAKLVVGAEMGSFFAAKIAGAGGDKSQSVLVRYGASKKIGGVTVTTVPAVHTNGLSPAFLTGNLAKELKENGLTAYLGPPSGYVLTFSNGLVAYLSGDTGVTAEQRIVVHDYYEARLAVINIGDVYTTGPKEAAWVIDELVEPKEVIVSHANEAATKDGKVQPGTKTDTFIKASDVPAHAPLSGKTMEFDGEGSCVSGC